MAITIWPALSELRQLRLYTKEILPDIAYETYILSFDTPTPRR